MKTEIVKTTTVKLAAEEGKTLVKVEKSTYGTYKKGDELYNIHFGVNISAAEADAKNWQEVDSLEYFMEANGFEKVEENA